MKPVTCYHTLATYLQMRSSKSYSNSTRQEVFTGGVCYLTIHNTLWKMQENTTMCILKKQKRLKSGSAVISVTTGAVEIVKTYRLHLLLILLQKMLLVGYCDCFCGVCCNCANLCCNVVQYVDTTLIFMTLKNLIMFLHNNNIEHKTCKKS